MVRCATAWIQRAAAATALLTFVSGTAHAQKTDVVKLANGDRITCEVSSLSRGQLTVSTDDAGTIYFEWDKVVALQSTAQFDVITVNGDRFFGSLVAGPLRTLVVNDAALGEVSLRMTDVTLITPIGASFWKQLDGSLDIGFSYTRSSHIAQLTLNSTTVYRRPAFEVRLTGSGTLTQNETDGERDDRGTIQGSYLRYRGQRLFVGGGVGFESNESLGLILRSQVAGIAGSRLINSNRAQLSVGAGLSANDEQNVDAEPTQNLEGLFTFRTSYYSVPSPPHKHRHQLPVLPEPHELGPPAHPARLGGQARGVEGRLLCRQSVRHIRQPATHGRRRSERFRHLVVVRLDLLAWVR